MPLEYALEHYMSDDLTFAVTLEYGKKVADPFNVERVHREDAHRADESLFLHPIVRRYERGTLVDEHHILEDLAAEWLEPEHTDPLVEYLHNTLTLTSHVRSIADENDDMVANVSVA
jgi:hypothetical protein